MNSKDWKKYKRSGGYRRKVKMVYENMVTPNTSEKLQNDQSGTEVTAGGSVEDYFMEHESEQENTEEYICSGSDSDTDISLYEELKNIDIRSDIRDWAVKFNISHNALSDLLKIMHNVMPHKMPIDARTLLKTNQVEIYITEIGNGHYWHNGLLTQLQTVLRNHEVPNKITLNFNIDGLPIYKSSNRQLWPILCNVTEIKNMSPIVVGIYEGKSKPSDLNLYLNPFVNEMKQIENGFTITTFTGEQKIIEVSIRAFICDSPARAFIKDCLHLQLYRDPKDRFKKGQTKASLSLQQFLGFESGFTLDKESNTIAIICQDVIVVLAFETRERLIAWQVKVGGQLGSSKEWLVMIGGGSRKLPAGPARLHLQGRRFALTSGVPPRLLGLWELAHLRRYGVVEGRFCFEGGSHCGKGEGLHVLITDQAQDITDGFDAATHGNPRAPPSRKSGGADRNRPDTRLSDLNADQSIPDTGLYEENFFGEDCGGVSPFWPSDERRGFDDHDCKCEEPGARPPWSGADHVTLERCSNCVTKLGTMTRSSTVALTPGTHFNPAWTMEAVPESISDNSSNSTEYLTPRAIKKSLEDSQCKEWAPQRPPKPARLEEVKAAAPLPTVAACTCTSDRNSAAHTGIVSNPKVGPYENYDVPKTTHVEVESANEYYDTPKRIKKALAEDLFQVTKNSAPGNLVLKKNCGCILKFGSKKKPVIVECDENIQPVECPCQKVTNWANNLISLPYCKRSVNYEKVNTEVVTSQKAEEMALYATVDVSRKANRQSSIAEKESLNDCNDLPFMNYENLGPKGDIEFEDPYANYENLEFALSLEYYENAKDLLKKAGVTQKELDALSANVDFADAALPPKPKHCAKCGHSAKYQAMKKNKSDEYLLMEPPKDIKRDLCRTTGPNPGYTPMSPNPNWSHSLRHPLQKLHRVDIEKSLSIPTLNGSANRMQSFEITSSTNNNKEAIQKRSSSVDSARLLEDLKEFDSSIGSHATSSSLETLRNLAIENRRSSTPCDNERDCCDHDCCKSSDSENKTSDGSCSKDIPHLRNKHMDNAQIKRSSSVPCKSGGNRDSSSSNDSGVSSCSNKHGSEFNEFEMPLTSGHSRYQYMAQRRMRGNATGCIHSSLPRKSKSSDPLRDMTMQIHKANVPAKSSSAEAEVPVLPPKQFKGVMDTHSTSSGTSDMSDYIETLSLTSSHSSSDNPNLRLARQPTTTLRPRSGKEYHNLDPIITSMYKSGRELSNYTNLP